MDEDVRKAFEANSAYLRSLQHLRQSARPLTDSQGRGLQTVIEITRKNIEALRKAMEAGDKRRITMSLFNLPGDSRLFDYSGDFEAESVQEIEARYTIATAA